jgi:hypothetical protein
MLYIIILFNIIFLSGSLCENFDEYRSRLISNSRRLNDEYYERKIINYLTLDNISSKYNYCIQHYNEYVKPKQTNNQLNENVSFQDYLEYWWNLEESEEELLDRICKYITMKFPKKYIRTKY